jgi:SpoVK/Ycf46/Vps4 family AAA+-type ATPase
VPLPDRDARLAYAQERLAQADMSELQLVGITVEQLASLTAGLLRRHIENILLRGLANTKKLTREIALHAQRELMDVEYAGIVKRIDKPFKLADFGGSPEALNYMRKRVIEAARRPSSVLFVGPPGTGKTLLATATANESGLNCLEVDLANLMGGIVGETEKNIATFKQAVLANAPTIVFMDEIDQKARRGEGGPDSGGGGSVENRLFARAGRNVYLREQPARPSRSCVRQSHAGDHSAPSC